MAAREKIRALMTACKDDPDDLDFITSRVDKFREYVNHIAFMEIQMDRMRINDITGAEWRDKVQDLDKGRRICHDAAIAAVNQLNRLAEAEGVDPIYTGPDDRTSIGEFCMAAVSDYFETRRGTLIDKQSFETAVNEVGNDQGRGR